MPTIDYFDGHTLLDRLTNGVLKGSRRVVFLVGSPLTAPAQSGELGVPGVGGVIDLIRAEFAATPQAAELEAVLASASNPYQEAFWFLIGRRGQQAANEIIRRSVWMARLPLIGETRQYVPSGSTADDICRTSDEDIDGWALPPAVEALGKLIAAYPDRFGREILTTNFDPLLEVAIERAGSHHFRTMLHRDGNLSQTQGSGCHVIHLHGYWHGADTLHTPRQLTQPRPRLKASIATLTRGKTLVVSGYGGWDDAFMEALKELVVDDNEYPEIIWTCRDAPPNLAQSVTEKLAPGVDRGRVNFYAGVDCHQFFPRLVDEWQRIEPAPTTQIRTRSNKIKSIAWVRETSAPRSTTARYRSLEGEDEDRPPTAEFCVGRDLELRQLLESTEPVCFITGIGGQGKSTLAAEYFSEAKKRNLFDTFVWKDCKEEAERLETQLISIIEGLTEGVVLGSEIANSSIETLAELVIKHSRGKRVLFVFDNVDHYVDLEHDRLNEATDGFVRLCAQSESQCRFLFTCRPTIRYPDRDVLVSRVGGLPLEATKELFEKRGAKVTAAEVGHALKAKTNVDTRYDTGHHLALAQRDSGDVDSALKFFLKGSTLEDVIDVDEFDETEGGPFYGNIGRCLHLMGQIDPAIICYRKSAISIEKDQTQEHFVNQGFVRKWIGELLQTKADFCSAEIFLRAAKRKWEQISPHRAAEVSRLLSAISLKTQTCRMISDTDLERFCVAWMYGREDEFEASSPS